MEVCNKSSKVWNRNRISRLVGRFNTNDSYQTVGDSISPYSNVRCSTTTLFIGL
jgi:hypothetical protein